MFAKALLICFVLLLLGFPVQAQDTVASVKSVSGEVSLIRGESVNPAKAGMFLLEGDMLITGTNSSAGVIFLDGTRISIGAESELSISKYRFEPIKQEYSFDIYMKKGSAAYSSGRLGHLAPDSVRFNTPQATVGIRGTTFMVKVE
jgi:hypothetical protein